MTIFIDVAKENREVFLFDEPEDYVVFIHNVSGKFSFELIAKCRVDIFGIFIGYGNESYSIETVQHHKHESSFSNLFIKGVFKEASRLSYQGLIRIEKEGQGSHAYQKNQNLILSPDVFVESNPFLEILANDVFCTHGSTTGKLNVDELFYVESRGVSRDFAEDILIGGFVNEVVDLVKEKVPDFEFVYN